MVRLSAHGVLVVDKPRGPTSHDVVARARRLYATRDVGHAGTLDPMATGVLVLLFGEALKLSNYATQEQKTYVARVAFGRSTTTGDAEGATLEECERTTLELEPRALEAALEVERARSSQVPPAVSAIKVGGRRAHALSRAGAPPELAPRAVRVHELAARSFDGVELELELRVSKGYYVRSLAHDLGETLGVPAHLAALRRTRSGCFSLTEAVAWPLAEPTPLLSLEDAARRLLPALELTEQGALFARQGKRLSPEHFAGFDDAVAHAPISAWLDTEGRLVAIGRRDDSGELVVVRGFRHTNS